MLDIRRDNPYRDRIYSTIGYKWNHRSKSGPPIQVTYTGDTTIDRLLVPV